MTADGTPPVQHHTPRETVKTEVIHPQQQDKPGTWNHEGGPPPQGPKNANATRGLEK